MAKFSGKFLIPKLTEKCPFDNVSIKGYQCVFWNCVKIEERFDTSQKHPARVGSGIPILDPIQPEDFQIRQKSRDPDPYHWQ
jgi:hypothetical protein